MNRCEHTVMKRKKRNDKDLSQPVHTIFRFADYHFDYVVETDENVLQPEQKYEWKNLPIPKQNSVNRDQVGDYQ